MIIILKRKFEKHKATLGELLIEKNGEWDRLCYTLEDRHQDEKVYGETRIPAGTYPLKFRKEGRFYQRYKTKFSSLDNVRGMLHITDIPNYKYVMIHIGNYHRDSKGCPLVGTNFAQTDTELYVNRSTDAYKKVYPILAKILEDNDDVYLDVIDE